MAFSGGATQRPTTSAALAVKFGSLLSHQDLRAARSILWLRRNRQTYWTSTSPSASASRGPGPARKPLRWRLVQQLQNPLVGRLRINRLLARPRLVLQPFKAMVGIAMPPKADNPRLDPNFLGDRPGAAPVRCQQNDPRPLQIALQRHRRATTRL